MGKRTYDVVVLVDGYRALACTVLCGFAASGLFGDGDHGPAIFGCFGSDEDGLGMGICRGGCRRGGALVFSGAVLLQMEFGLGAIVTAVLKICQRLILILILPA